MLDFNYNYYEKHNAQRVSIQANHHYVLAPVAPEVAGAAGWQIAGLLLLLYVQAWADEERPKGVS